MEILGLIMLIAGIIACVYAYHKIKNQKQIDKEIEETNKKLLQNFNNLSMRENNLKYEIDILEQQHKDKTERLKELNQLTEDMNKSAASAFAQYVEALESSYKQIEEEFESNIETLDNSYINIQDQYISKIDSVKADLDKISATRAAAIEAQLNEERIKKEKEFYSIKLSTLELKDVKVLRSIEPQLNNPRVLSMLIWQTFYRDRMTEVCNNVLGATTVTGIYKITNQLNGIYYIGQAVDVAKRWKDHAKCGLGIDAPASNKMYAAMQQDGLENFTWELLEKCSSIELNEKEKFYIELYQAKEYGYNSTKGNK